MIDRRTLLASALALGADLSLGSGARAAAGDIALTRSGNRYYAQVRVNGAGPFRFVLDTGATAHFVSRPVAERLRLLQVGEGRLRAFGGRSTQGLTQLESFDVGGVVAEDVRAVVVEPELIEGHDGLVGYPILGSRARLDLQAGVLSLGARAPDDAVQVEAQVSDSQILLIAAPELLEGRFVFDTGAPDCVVSRAYHARLARTPGYTQWPKLMRKDAQGSLRIVGFRPPELRFGELELPQPVVNIARADASPELFHEADALLGADLLRRCAWTLERRALYASPSSASA